MADTLVNPEIRLLPSSATVHGPNARFLGVEASHEPDGGASLSPASRVGRVPRMSSGSPGWTRPSAVVNRVQIRKEQGPFHEPEDAGNRNRLGGGRRVFKRNPREFSLIATSVCDLFPFHASSLLSKKLLRIRRSRNAMPLRRDCTVILLILVEGSLFDFFGTIARADRSQRLAQANSTARIASPSGITMKAGPGSTTSARPRSRTVPPSTTTKMRRM